MSMRWGERVSRRPHEEITVPVYEEGARKGVRCPHRFRWRRRWFRVVDVISIWEDGRKNTRDRPGPSRCYFNVATDPDSLFQLYFVRSNKKGSGTWMLYRQMEILPVSR